MNMVPYATDDFNRANGPLSDANWFNQPRLSSNYFSIVSNAIEASSSGTDDGAVFVRAYWLEDQYSQAKITVSGGTASGGQGYGVWVRSHQGSGDGSFNGYRAIVNSAASNNVELTQWIAGTPTSLGFRTATWVNGDVLKLEVIGTTLKMYQNGIQLGADFTDSIIVSGAPGVAISTSFTSGSIDDWEGGGPPRFVIGNL